MARIRTIKPETWKDEALANVCRDARLLFIGLWNVSDDYGVLRCNPRLIKAEVFPYDVDVSAERVGELIQMLEQNGFLVRYEREGQQYAWIRNFTKHQRIDKPSKTNLLPQPTAGEMATPRGLLALKPGPAVNLDEHSASPPRGLQEDSKRAPGGLPEGMEGNGMEGNGKDSAPTSSPHVGEFKLAAQEPPPAKSKKPKPEAQSNPLHDPTRQRWEAAFRKERGADYRWSGADAKALSDLLEHSTPDEIIRRAVSGLRRKFRTADTMLDVRTNWNAYATDEPQGDKRKSPTRAEDMPKELMARTGDFNNF